MNRTFLIALIVLLVVFAGITLSVHQAKSPLILRIVSQQSEIIDLLRRTDRLLTQEKRTPAEDQAANMKGLEQQLVLLGKKIDALSVAVKNIKTAKPPQRPAPAQEDFSKVHEIPVAHSPSVTQRSPRPWRPGSPQALCGPTTSPGSAPQTWPPAQSASARHSPQAGCRSK